MKYIDSVFGDLACYRKWRGGKWSMEFIPDCGGWSTGFEVWTRAEDR